MEKLKQEELMTILEDFFKFKHVNSSKYYKALIKHCNNMKPDIIHTKETAFSYITKDMKKNYSYGEIILCSFVWNDTDQGSLYWAKLHDEFQIYFKNIHNKMLYKD